MSQWMRVDRVWPDSGAIFLITDWELRRCRNKWQSDDPAVMEAAIKNMIARYRPELDQKRLTLTRMSLADFNMSLRVCVLHPLLPAVKPPFGLFEASYLVPCGKCNIAIPEQEPRWMIEGVETPCCEKCGHASMAKEAGDGGATGG